MAIRNARVSGRVSGGTCRRSCEELNDGSDAVSFEDVSMLGKVHSIQLGQNARSAAQGNFTPTPLPRCERNVLTGMGIPADGQLNIAFYITSSCIQW